MAPNIPPPLPCAHCNNMYSSAMATATVQAAMATDTVQGAQEAARVTILTAVKGVANGVITVGAKTPIVAPLCVALLEAKDVVDRACRNKEELKEVSARCGMIAVQVIAEFKTSPTSTIDVTPLEKCVEKLEEVARRYHDQGRLSRMVQFRRDGDDIRRLSDRIDAVVPIMGLAGVFGVAEGVASIEDRLKDVQKMVVSSSNIRRVSITLDDRAHPATHGWLDHEVTILHLPPHPTLHRLVCSRHPS